MKKSVIIYLLLLLPVAMCGQNRITATDSVIVSGAIKQQKIISLKDLAGLQVKNIKDVVVTNHLGEKKGTAKGMKGILLRDILSPVEFNAESPKVLSEYFLTLIASDGYKVVYSWNELFNTSVGDNTY